MFEFESETPEQRIDQQVGYAQATERSFSRSAASVTSLASMFAFFSTLLIRPISLFSDAVDRFQDTMLSGISTFTSLIDGLFAHLSTLDDALASSSLYRLLKYISGLDLIIPFFTDYISPVLLVVLYVLTTFFLISVTFLVSVVIFNITRRLISILPFFKAI